MTGSVEADDVLCMQRVFSVIRGWLIMCQVSRVHLCQNGGMTAFILFFYTVAANCETFPVPPFIPLRSPSTTFSDVSATYPAPATLAITIFTSLPVCSVYWTQHCVSELQHSSLHSYWLKCFVW